MFVDKDETNYVEQVDVGPALSAGTVDDRGVVRDFFKYIVKDALVQMGEDVTFGDIPNSIFQGISLSGLT